MTAELDALEAKPLRVRWAYAACDCKCPSGHEGEAAPAFICRVCGDKAEKHYLMIGAADTGRLVWYHARRGHDDDDGGPDTCEGAKQ